MKGVATADRWTFGGTPRMVGLNVDPSRSEALPVRWDGLGTDVVVAEPGAGDDRIDATGVKDRHVVTIMQGGPGADIMLGSPFRGALSGGRGRDVLRGGAGSDELDGRERDELDGGAGNDRARPGPKDSVTACEKVSRSGRG
ncbi:MAG: hypothetical protein ACHQCF_07530 [Solirubrobacterales bacterium]